MHSALMKVGDRTTAVRTRTSRAVKMIRLLAVALLLTTALAAVGGPRLEAEAAGYGSIKTCVEFQSGAPFSNRSLNLRFANGTVRYGTTNASGCGTFYNVPVNTLHFVEAIWYSQPLDHVFYGRSPQSGHQYLPYPGAFISTTIIVR
jgi:hypothetical protein